MAAGLFIAQTWTWVAAAFSQFIGRPSYEVTLCRDDLLIAGKGHLGSEFKSCKSPEMPDEEDDIPLDLILKEEQIEVIANGTLATDEKGTTTYEYG